MERPLDPEEPLPDAPLGDVPADRPVADVVEQHQAADAAPDVDERAPLPADVPEADVLEQREPVPPEDDWETDAT